MKRLVGVILLVLALTIGDASALAFSSGSRGEKFDVTVTNFIRGQQFTPILVASHEGGVNLFTLGESASRPPATLAETGDTGPLATLLMGTPGVNDVVTVGPPPDPGTSRIITITGGENFIHVSVAPMLTPTNDGFIRLNWVKGLTGNTLTFFSSAYDAGNEAIDEHCSSIPRLFFEECGGSGGGGAPGGGEKYVHIRAGIHWIWDMDAGDLDYLKPRCQDHHRPG